MAGKISKVCLYGDSFEFLGFVKAVFGMMRKSRREVRRAIGPRYIFFLRWPNIILTHDNVRLFFLQGTLIEIKWKHLGNFWCTSNIFGLWKNYRRYQKKI